ncbi:UDP-glucuronosyltransferase 2A3 [Ceratitis capitata]|uniref:UDP-glucuronosyltransferase n=1 Tax=Ceratitis capitata TaxID=7213 RepID=A0A811UFB7_CERCA|nr:UDP-glucuronosyltransferase 2A3 [Ceratitis capitata]CAD6995923.1 unnamed protein product [Ceratitis capitata]
MKKYTPLTSLLLLLVINASFFESLNGAKILAIFPFSGRSQYICAENYLKALAARGHNVTVISAFPQAKPLQNFNDVPIVFESHDWSDIILDGNFPSISTWEALDLGIDFLTSSTRKVLEHPEVQKWLTNGDTFDLLIVEALEQDALYALAHHFKALLVGVSSFGTDIRIDELVDNVSPLSYIPAVTSHFTDHMNFYQRLESLYISVLDMLHYHYKILPLQYDLYREYVKNPTTDFMEIRKNFSLLLLNQHFSIGLPRPYVPNAIEVAGFHISHKPKSLPTDMEEFINASANGAIYFSLGSNINSKNLSKEKISILMKVFAALPYNILWKFEAPELPGKPKNVYISKWFPQADILAHPKVKLFITHGGLLSTIETIHYGKPIVGMAIMYDQFINMVRAEAKGFALSINFGEFTAAGLKSAILEVLQNPKYAQRAAEISRLYHDQPMKPLERAIYWTEYTLRHHGAPHMRVAARDLNFFEYHSIDTITVLFGVPLCLLVFTLWLMYKLMKIIARSWNVQNKKEKVN